MAAASSTPRTFACDIFCSIHFAIDDIQIADAWQHTGQPVVAYILRLSRFSDAQS